MATQLQPAGQRDNSVNGNHHSIAWITVEYMTLYSFSMQLERPQDEIDFLMHLYVIDGSDSSAVDENTRLQHLGQRERLLQEVLGD
jgi:undecaprenyl diphosphate synthase